MDAVAEIKKVLGKTKPKTILFGYPKGEFVEVLLIGDFDDLFEILVEGFHQAIASLRQDGANEEEILETAEDVLGEMRKTVAAPAKGPRLVE